MDEVFVITKLIYDRRQKELGQLALNWVFLHILTSKEGYILIAFPLPSPPCNVVPMFELP